MSDEQVIAADDVADLGAVLEHSENVIGKSPVEVPISTGETVTIHVPDDNTDQVIRYEDPDGVKHEYVNPNAAEIADAEGDVIWDGASKSYIPRVVQGEAGAGVEATTIEAAVAAAEAGSSSESAAGLTP